MVAVEFLGWDRPGLELAAEWLARKPAPELAKLVVALPGGRAGRRLLELLVRRVSERGGCDAFEPPSIIRAGLLLDELVRTESEFAGRLVRTLTWTHALRDQTPAALGHLLARPPDRDDLPAWLALSEDIRTLHGELAAGGIGFDAARAVVASRGIAAEAARWKTLAGVQRAYRDRLAALGLTDPHDARREALENGALDEGRKLVLVGVPELSRLQRRLLDALGDRATVLVLAPESSRDSFDEHGCVRADAWAEREIPLALEQWWVENEPSDQAARVARILAGWGERFSAEQISIGVPDGSVTPFIERRLGEEGVGTRVAAGREVSTTGPWRLCQAAAELLDGNRYAALAALVRHPDLAAVLPRALDEQGLTPAECVDAWAQRHLPDRVPGRGAGRSLRALLDALYGLLGELSSRDRRPLPDWVDPVIAFLQAVYGERTLDVERNEDDRVLHAVLVALAKALDEIASLNGEQGRDFLLTASGALHLLLRSTAQTAVAPEPADPRAARQPIELLGWVELALDDAPALLITGFNEGHVPEPVRRDAFLPDRLRAELGLPDAEQRRARDAYTLALILSSGRQVALVGGRRRTEGDPLRPSRLAFHCPDEEIVERVRRVLSQDAASGAAATRDEAQPPPWTPAILPVAPREAISVSQISRYMNSPLEFYLLDEQRLRPIDDELHELAPPAFGNLAHAVLERFARSELKDSADAVAISKLLDELLDERKRALFGAKPMASVALQVEQLRRRLHDFGVWQAGQVADGWRIEHVEWAPEGGGSVPFVVDGQPIALRGRIDRIDLHADGVRWRVLDYKTSEEAKHPRKVHGPRTDGRWRDLQLPLYSLLVAPLVGPLVASGFEPAPTLGYVALPRDLGGTELLAADWTEAEREDALERARDAVRGIRAGEFSRVGDFRSDEPILLALAGIGLLGGATDDEPEEKGE